jgi:threonine dehydratase
MKLSVNLEDIRNAHTRLKPFVHHTPLLRGEKLDELIHCQAHLKPECLQITGSFKLRGATNKILSLTDEEKAKGIIASSSGNHAQGVAFAAKSLGIKATLVLPENAPLTKIEGTKALGAEVILYGFDSIQRYKKLYEIVDEKGYTVVHSYDDPKLIAGQGTVGYEVLQDIEDLDAIVVPLGGGGLLAGIAVAVKEMNPKVRVIGVEPEAIPRYSESRKLGKPVEVPMKDTIADGLMITKTGVNTYPIIEKYVDEVVTVSDDYIYQALPEVIFKTKLVVEPSAVIGVAAAIEGNIALKKDEKVCFVLSGGNIDSEKLIQFLRYKEN